MRASHAGPRYLDRQARFLRAACITFLLLTVASTQSHAAPLPRESRVPGGVAIVRVADTTSPAPRVTREGVRVWVTAHRIGKDAPGWYAVVGIPLSTEPGEQAINVNDGGVDRTVSFEVKDKKYPVQKITFADKRMVEPNPDDLVRIEREGKHLGQVKRTWHDASDTSAAFQLPAKGRLSSPFGARRVLNGEARSPHAGLDVAVGTGTPIHSAAAGVVIDTGNYYFGGNMVWIDHGNALMSAYRSEERRVGKECA